MTELKPLKQHQDERHAAWQAKLKAEAEPTGIACPTCGSELVNPTPDVLLASHPPQIRIKCTECLYTGFGLK